MIVVTKIEIFNDKVIKAREKYINNVNVPLNTFYIEENLPGNLDEFEVLDNYAISRAMVITEIYERAFNGKSSEYEDLTKDFFYDAYIWFNDFVGEGGSKHFKGLYSREDLLKPITWCEVGYLWYYALNKEPELSLSELKPSVKVCVLKETDPNSQSRFNHKLKDYKAGLSIGKYLKDIKDGKRYMPVCLYHSFECLAKRGIIGDGCFLKELNKGDLEKFFGLEGV